MSWAAAYIGQPWTPERDCWAFFRDVQREAFGREVPAIDIDALSLTACLRTFKAHPERGRWLPTDDPQDGDGVLLARGRLPSHVGIWVDGGRVLHSLEGFGVVCQRVADLRAAGWSRIDCYRFSP
jgi:cell wall-associated NlpC family hydrolase